MKNKPFLFLFILATYAGIQAQQAAQPLSWWQKVKEYIPSFRWAQKLQPVLQEVNETKFHFAEKKLQDDQARIDQQIEQFLKSQTSGQKNIVQSAIQAHLENQSQRDKEYLRYIYQGPHNIIFTKTTMPGELPFLGSIKRYVTSPDNYQTIYWSYLLYGPHNQPLGIIATTINVENGDPQITDIQHPELNLFDYEKLFGNHFQDEFKEVISQVKTAQTIQLPLLIEQQTEIIPETLETFQNIKSSEEETLRTSLESGFTQSQCKIKRAQTIADYKKNPLFKKIVERTQRYYSLKGIPFKFYVYMNSNKNVQLTKHLKTMELFETDYAVKGILQGQIVAPRPLDELTINYTIYHPAFKIAGTTISTDKINAVPLETGTYTITLNPESIRFNTNNLTLLFPPLRQLKITQRENTIGIKKPITTIPNKVETLIAPILADYFTYHTPQLVSLSKENKPSIDKTLLGLSKKTKDHTLFSDKKYFDFNQGLASITLLNLKDLEPQEPYMMLAINGKINTKTKAGDLLIRLEIVSANPARTMVDRKGILAAMPMEVKEVGNKIVLTPRPALSQNATTRDFAHLVISAPSVQNYIIDKIKETTAAGQKELDDFVLL